MPGIALHHRLAALGNTPPGTEARLEVQWLVWRFVDDRKAAGWPPERVIIAVKQIARAAGIQPSSFIADPVAPLTGVDGFLVDMVGWCIHRYYGDLAKRAKGPLT
jgi:hypothetical protein